MTAALVAVAKRVAEKIEKVGIHEAYDLGRNYGNFNDLLEVTNKLCIDVFGQSYPRSELETRDSVVYEVVISVAVRKLFGVPDQSSEDAGRPRIKTDEVDALVGVVQNLFEFWLLDENRTDTVDGYSVAIVHEDSKITVPCNWKMLRDLHQFVGHLKLTFRCSKELTEE